ncbi:hypothetical protein DFH07DRAFT_515598 [Mycena maculata]|uniref:Uncharacterized protein n=1 Tax=Mycena maculata TaxID=230809 RepID=A0AAD7IYC0_9AGAR|nr:hypothetical protein DFH07DRAFT_515598 [Mycena maculata]
MPGPAARTRVDVDSTNPAASGQERSPYRIRRASVVWIYPLTTLILTWQGFERRQWRSAGSLHATAVSLHGQRARAHFRGSQAWTGRYDTTCSTHESVGRQVRAFAAAVCALGECSGRGLRFRKSVSSRRAATHRRASRVCVRGSRGNRRYSTDMRKVAVSESGRAQPWPRISQSVTDSERTLRPAPAMTTRAISLLASRHRHVARSGGTFVRGTGK